MASWIDLLFAALKLTRLQSYLEDVPERVAPYLDAPLLQQLRQLIDPGSPQKLFGQAHVTMTWLNVLAFERKPVKAGHRRTHRDRFPNPLVNLAKRDFVMAACDYSRGARPLGREQSVA